MEKQQDMEKFEFEIFSFGFKNGVPAEINYIFDVRFLPNPYWDESLRAKSGLQKEVSDYVLESPEGEQFIEKFLPFITLLKEQNIRAGKKKLTVAVGCTGGRHRSVSVVERLKKEFDASGCQVDHRDITKDKD